jgi:hypothetical protein
MVRAAIKALSLSLSLTCLAAPALALDITWINILWTKARVDGSLQPDPFSMNIIVDLAEAAGLGAVEVVTPGGGIGTVSLTPSGGPTDPTSWGGTGATRFSTNAILFSNYPNGTYTINLLDSPGGTVLDFFSVALSVTEVTDFLDVTAPAHLSTVPTNQTVTWADCSACDGNGIGGFANEIPFKYVDNFITTDMATTSWAPSKTPWPSGLVANTDYEFEMILSNDTHWGSELSNGGDSFTFVAGYESVNSIEVTTVPEPTTGLLFACGLVGLAMRRRRVA